MNVTEAQEIYRARQKLAKRYVSEHSGNEWNGCLPVLESILPGIKELSTVSLGVSDVPLSRIRGTLTAGRASAFAGNFLPVLSEGSEFAAKWISLYASHMSEGIRDPGTAYEYLGYYYIVEGHKRVSVLVAAGAASIQLDVQRVIPPDGLDTDEVLIYKEFLNIDIRMPLRGMWFTRRGSFTELYSLSQSQKEDKPDDWMYDAFYDFRQCYHEPGLDCPGISTGDAFYEYVRVYGIPYMTEPGELKRNMRHMERQLMYRAGMPAPPVAPASIEIITDPDASIDTLRKQLEDSETLYFLCSPDARDDILATFYGNMDEPSFVLGALAGSLSKTGTIGWVSGKYLTDAAAFEQGAAMVRAGVKVIQGGSTETMGEQDADMVLLPYEGENLRGPGFPGVYARLVGMSNGYINEYYAAAAWDYKAFSEMITETLKQENGMLRGQSPGSESIHLVLGLESGLLKLHMNRAVLSSLSLRLVEVLSGGCF